MDKETRNRIQRATQTARTLLEREYAEQLDGIFDIRLDGSIGAEPGSHLDAAQRVLRTKLATAVDHQSASGLDPAEAVASYLREAAFTMLNRFVALKMLEARGLVQECVSRGDQSAGFKEFSGLAPGLAQVPDHGYRLYIESLFDEIGREVRVLFDRRDPAGLLWPRRQTLADLLVELNATELAAVWKEDETIGWVYQYFNSDEERRRMRAESEAPRNSRELAVRNQFFTPRYVVEFLTDNTLGRIWYEMTRGDTRLIETCTNLVQRPGEVFLAPGQDAPEDASGTGGDVSPEEGLNKSVHVPFRAKKDPRDLKILDPACGSGHFLLYAFDLLVAIYEEAWKDDTAAMSEVTTRRLRDDYFSLEGLRREIPGLVLRHNLYGIEIDPRAAQIAALALWMRAQRAYNELGLSRGERPAVAKTNIVVAEPMPGETECRTELVASVDKQLGPLVARVFDKMELAGEAGSLLRIEDEIQAAIRDIYGETGSLFRESDEERWRGAESELIAALHAYAERTQNGRAYRRRLFADDAARGLAFVDICRERFDVILMNPPFGEVSTRIGSYCSSKFPSWNQNVLCAFIERCLGWLASSGSIGVIFDRTAIVKSTYETFRRSVLMRSAMPTACADLGWNVLDAQVEVVSMVLSQSHPMEGQAIFIDARNASPSSKGDQIKRVVLAARSARAEDGLYVASIGEFLRLPNAVFGYDFPAFLVHAFSRQSSLEASGYRAYQGHALRSEQHFRLWYEAEIQKRGKSQASPLYNGSEFTEYTAPLRDVVVAARSLVELARDSGTVLRNLDQQGQPGVCYGVRGDFLDAHVLPAGRVFTVEGQALPIREPHDRLLILALLNSSLFRFGLNLYSGQHKYSGYINLFPLVVPANREVVEEAVTELICKRLELARLDETQPVFSVSQLRLARECGFSLENTADALMKQIMNVRRVATTTAHVVNQAFEEAYGASDVDRERFRELDRLSDSSALPFTDLPTDCETLLQFLAAEIISFVIGRAFGRWKDDALGGAIKPIDTVELDSWPKAAALLRESAADSSEPRVLVDDPGHDSDIVASIWALLPSEELGSQLSSVLSSTADVRSWLRGAFFEHHQNRYSKSRRRAAIYWQLATPSARYSVWLYYPRLSKETLYEVANDYVTPKLQHEERKLAGIVQSAAGNPTASQRREIAEQEVFVAEVRALRDEVARIAPLWKPNLSDGVLVNFAPLWRVVPHHRAWQKECKECWDRLVGGEHEWAQMAMHLWPERVVPKCAEDRSLAIAHGLEEVFWVEGDDGKWQRRKIDEAVIKRLVAERTSSAVKDALKSLVEVPAPRVRRAGGRRKAPRRRATTQRTEQEAATAGPVGSTEAEALEGVREAVARSADGASKSDVLAATGITEAQWNAAIGRLLSQGVITKRGERRRIRYHIAETEGRS